MKIYILCKNIDIVFIKYSPLTLLQRTNRRFSRYTNSLHKSSSVHGVDLHDEELSARLQEIKHVFDLRDPGQFFMQARTMKRHVIFHAGPTNSGKTYNALEAFLSASNGIYCGPLRMLAGEIYRKANTRNVPCDMVTGEERLWAVSKEEPANHIACTVELCPTITKYDVAVIDEIQMLRCFDRGWAWTRALLGVAADEIHLCGEPSAINIVKKLLSKTNDTFEVKMYERKTPLKIQRKGVGGLQNLKEGDCVIAFSQRDIYSLRTAIEKRTKLKCAVIYGNLPSNVRFEQAENFNNGYCQILVASDAIGMGMNLNIHRISFSSLRKFDGDSVKDLTPHHIKQIAGRAGRYKSKYETGFVNTIESKSISKLKRLMKAPVKDIKKAGILPSFAQIELLSMAMPGKGLFELLEVFEVLMQLDRNYFICDLEKMKIVSLEIKDIPLSLSESFLFAIAPMNIIKSKFVCDSMKKFAWHVYDKKCFTEPVIKHMLNWPPNPKPRSLVQLQHLEYIHEVFDLYRWLSYRFEDIFADVEGIIELQKEVENLISRAVDANLKNYKRGGMFEKFRRKWRKSFTEEYDS